MSFLETLGRPLRITLIGVCCLAFLVYGGMAAFVSIVFVRFQLDNEPLDTSDADRIEQRIAARLDADDFGVVDHAVWSRLFARVFYAYGRVNRYERHPIETDREALVGILREAYDEIESVHRERMLTVGSVGVPGGAIYQWHRLHILALLAKYSRDPLIHKQLRDDSRILAEALESAAEHTLESYPGWAWWVDNVDAYLGLALADEVVWNLEYRELTDEWLREMVWSRDVSGNFLSEAYSLYPQLNQSRSPASAWILAYLPMLDPSMVESSLARFSASFESEFLGMPVVLETPGWERLINNISTGPTLFGVSSAGTMLALAAYGSTGELERAESVERTIRAAFFYDRSEGSVCFGWSLLLESLLYWWLSFRV